MDRNKKNFDFLKKYYDYIIIFIVISLAGVLEFIRLFFMDLYINIYFKTCFFMRIKEILLENIQYKIIPPILYSSHIQLSRSIISFVLIIIFSYIIYLGGYSILKYIYLSKIKSRKIRKILLVLFYLVIVFIVFGAYFTCRLIKL